MQGDVAIEMGWGRLIFGQTFKDSVHLAKAVRREKEDRRDIAFYICDPHVVVKLAPNELFLDPSHAFRMWAHNYRHQSDRIKGLNIRRLSTEQDAISINHLYALNTMVQCPPSFLLKNHSSRLRTYFVAESETRGEIIGTITGVDHVEAFSDPENGSSLWCLAVDPQANIPGVGEALVRHLLEHYFTRGRQFVDLSVMHDNDKAIKLYEKLGFQRIQVFCVKRKNPINEPLYVAPGIVEKLNPYAMIIINEARRRGIGISILDAEYGYFRLQLGGRSVVCRESLSELTTAVAMSRCDDKRVTHRVLKKAGLNVPLQYINRSPQQHMERRWVVKPARGEQGVGISVDIAGQEELGNAISLAQKECQDYIVEEYISGQDLRIVVINFEVVAAAVRKPPTLVGTGSHSIRQLIEKYNRRRMAATGGESAIPFDGETARCVQQEGYELDDTLPRGIAIEARKTANLHTGGTIHDVTDQLNPEHAKAAVKAARALDIAVTGLDFIVPDLAGKDYAIIEANERPGLANHEPQPTAEKFIDFLFPQTI
jgi:GNAT-family acetyltransferase (TIGR03103 family)